MSKDVQNWFVEYHDSGIISLHINTWYKWVKYHRYTNHMYSVGNYSPDEKDVDEGGGTEKILRIPEDKLKFESGVSYIPTEIQEKDQITFYFIPRHLIFSPKNRKVEYGRPHGQRETGSTDQAGSESDA